MAFPITPSTLEFEHNQPILVTTSLNGREQRALIETQKYVIRATFSNLSDAERRQIQGFIAEQRGGLNAFDFTLPGDIGKSSAGYTGSITVDGDYTADDTAISIDTSAGLGQGILKKGDLVRIAGSNKTYMVSSDVSSADINGNATMNIQPGLLDDISDGAAITHISVPVNVRFSTSGLAYRSDPTDFATFTLEMIEVI
jgi:hypothetical protein